MVETESECVMVSHELAVNDNLASLEPDAILAEAHRFIQIGAWALAQANPEQRTFHIHGPIFSILIHRNAGNPDNE